MAFLLSSAYYNHTYCTSPLIVSYICPFALSPMLPCYHNVLEKQGIGQRDLDFKT